MKILYVTTIGITMTFFKELSKDLLDRGHTLDIITNEDIAPVPECYREWPCRIFHHDCARSPFSMGNLRAIRQIRSRVLEGGYDIVHCHTPIASFCTRLACIGLRKKGVKVVYTAHGFHFYKGAPMKNWLLYYTAEKLCAPLTDLLITINKEDYALAQKKLKIKRVLYVPGVGIDLNKFHPDIVSLSRNDFAIPANHQILLSVGELSQRKNHELLIRAIAQIENITLLIAGAGPLEQYLKDLALQLGCDVRFLGQRSDIAALCNICDLFVLPSFQEGLPVALMEAMACGKAVSCSRIRGNTDLLDSFGGTLFDPHSVSSCRDAVEKVLCGNRTAMGLHNQDVIRAFSVEAVNQQMFQIYESF